MTAPAIGFTELPRTPGGKIDKKLLIDQYLKSEHIEFYPFCAEFNYNPNAAKRYFDLAELKRQKRQYVEDVVKAELRDKLFMHKNRWEADVIKTMKDYPQLGDFCADTIKQYMYEINKAIVEQRKAEKLSADGVAPPDKLFTKKFKCSDIEAITRAFKNLVEAKHKALMIDGFSIRAIEKDSEEAHITEEGGIIDSAGEITYKIIGTDNVKTDKELAEFLASYYDRPPQKAIEENNDKPGTVAGSSAT